MTMLSTRRYIALSVCAAALAVFHAFQTREQFFPSMTYLSTSKISIAVLGNLGFAFALSAYKLMTWIFLGRLRDAEVERINDKISQAIVETLLAMTIFREDFTVSFVSMFVILSFVKIFHWLVQDRVDFIETTPNVTRLQHARIIAFASLLMAIDIAFLRYTISRTLTAGVSIYLLFAFEYAIQASTILTTSMKYALTTVDMAMEGGWEGKGLAVFYLDLALDLLHLIVYTAFFAVIFSTYGIPIHLVRDLYWTFRNFQVRVRDFLRYRRITANMEARFPDADEADLERAGHVCIVCREEMTTTTGRCKKLGCSHVFHLHCLRSWLERQQSCPICRAAVVPAEQQQQQPVVQQQQPAAAVAAAGGERQGHDGVATGQQQQQGAHGGVIDHDHALHLAAQVLLDDAMGQFQYDNNNYMPPGTGGGGGGEGSSGGTTTTAGASGSGTSSSTRRRRRNAASPAQLHQAAAAAAMYQPWPMHMMQQQHLQQQHHGMMPVMPMPFMLPPTAPGAVGTVALPTGTSGGVASSAVGQGTAAQQQAAAMVASFAAAAATAAASGGPLPADQIPIPTDPITLAAMKASAEAMKALLEGQLHSLHSHLERLVHIQPTPLPTMPFLQATTAAAPPPPQRQSTSSNTTSANNDDNNRVGNQQQQVSAPATSAATQQPAATNNRPQQQQQPTTTITNPSTSASGNSSNTSASTSNAGKAPQQQQPRPFQSSGDAKADELRRKRLQRFEGN